MLETHLSALQVSSHGSLVTDGEASVVQHPQEEQREAENQTSWNCQRYTCDLTAADRSTGLIKKKELSIFFSKYPPPPKKKI